jgi:hypothetical protein
VRPATGRVAVVPFLAAPNGLLALLMGGTVVDDLEIVLLDQMRQSLD